MEDDSEAEVEDEEEDVGDRPVCQVGDLEQILPTGGLDMGKYSSSKSKISLNGLKVLVLSKIIKFILFCCFGCQKFSFMSAFRKNNNP